MKTPIVCLALLAAMALPGCAGLGNVVIGHHPNSSVTSGFTEVLWCTEEANGLNCEKDRTGIAAIPPALLAEAIPIVLGLIHQGIETESKRYSATYSSRLPAILYQCTDRKPEPRIDAIRFVRKDGEEKEVARLDVATRIMPDGSALYLEPLAFDVAKTKSKVAFASPWPWHWLSSIIWGGWFLADPDIAKVDFNAKVTVDVVAEDAKKSRATLTVGSVDFPFGKKAIYDLKTLETTGTAPKGVPASAWMPLPKVDCSEEGVAMPVSFTVTVMEANDLGDVIAKGAEKFEEKQADIAKAIQQRLE